jgi:hypothetical protein
MASDGAVAAARLRVSGSDKEPSGEIRDIRDSMNRHTRITDKYTLKETIIAKP